MAKLKNPPPKRVRLTKNLGNETRKFLNWLDIMLFHYEGSIRELQSTLVNNGLADLRANWNTWWDQEKARRRTKSADPSKALQDRWRKHYET